ncbi:glycerol dehydratase reactivase beta/small subunit family protein [Thermohalobacter berrensis]|uniref:Glycerol dehydratase n=1 Tax=Thermohalobacter berrensis TaxID=99594 RepID=A0A419T5D9_9FIRM|nr:glycerol dehydratase reactivase beta/small subunit family protein [Thermohalobacter berrensis]RKD32754.1 hypothetical protein BET03_10500 [Thermohalobacter berrensis]
MTKNKVCINIYYSTKLNNILKFQQLLLGIEEEGIPYKIVKKSETSAVKLGYEACISSQLNVGIGIGCDEKVVVHYAKLPLKKPLFNIDTKDNINILRILGSNAARLVKGVPFKVLKS